MRESYLFLPEDEEKKGFHKQIKIYDKVGRTHLFLVPKKQNEKSQ